MVSLTVIILTKNEELNIEKCINSFKNIPKRFVIVDSGSDDKTEEICNKLSKKLKEKEIILDFYYNKWVNYATQFNWALENTNINTYWVMRMDADEELLPELADEINKRIDKIPNDITGIILKRRTIFMGRWLKHGGRYPEYLLRIWRNGKAICEQKIMDEHMLLSEGKTITFKYDLKDENKKDLKWWIEKHNWYSDREVLDHQMYINSKLDNGTLIDNKVSTKQAKIKRFYKNNMYYRLPLFARAHIYYIYRYYIRLGFLDGQEGKIYSFLQAYWYRFLVDAKIYESKKGEKND